MSTVGCPICGRVYCDGFDRGCAGRFWATQFAMQSYVVVRRLKWYERLWADVRRIVRGELNKSKEK